MQAVFYCHCCAAAAITIELVWDGDRPSLRSTGFVGQISDSLGPEMAPQLHAALETSSALAIYTLDRLWMPCYCPDCATVYCSAHWRIYPQFDGEFAGWYDCSYGQCPNGHWRLVDD